MNINSTDGRFGATDRQSSFAVGKYLLMGAVSVAAPLAISATAQADVIVNYNFTPVDWLSSSSPYPADGAAVSGTLSYDWTTHTAMSSDFTSTASTAPGWTTQTFTNMSQNYLGGGFKFRSEHPRFDRLV